MNTSESNILNRHAPGAKNARKVPNMNKIRLKAAEQLSYFLPVSEEVRAIKDPEYQDLPILGPYKYNDGSTYQGQYKNGLRTGYGRKVLKTGSVYEGYWENDEPHNHGVFLHVAGGNYIGNWKQGKVHGKAIFKHFTGARYIGEWKDGLQDGFGKEYCHNGDIYEGEYKAGYKHGEGVFKMRMTGGRYEGQFYRNKIEGKGRKNQ